MSDSQDSADEQGDDQPSLEFIDLDSEYPTEVCATLRVSHSAKPPEVVTEMLGLAPTETLSGTESASGKSAWRLSTEGVVDSTDIGAHLSFLADRLSPLSDELNRLGHGGWEVDLSVSFSGEGNEEFQLEPDVMHTLSHLPGGVRFDLRFPRDDSEPTLPGDRPNDTYATICFYHPLESAQTVTDLLRITPTSTASPSPRFKSRPNGWFLESRDSVKSDRIGDHLSWAVEPLQANAESVSQLVDTGWEPDVSIFFYSRVGSHAFSLEPDVMRALGRLRAKLWFDMYLG